MLIHVFMFPSLPLLFFRLPFLDWTCYLIIVKKKIPITSQEFKLCVAFQQNKLYITREYTHRRCAVYFCE
jgi:hypothetical protein